MLSHKSEYWVCYFPADSKIINCKSAMAHFIIVTSVCQCILRPGDFGSEYATIECLREKSSDIIFILIVGSIIKYPFCFCNFIYIVIFCNSYDNWYGQRCFDKRVEVIGRNSKWIILHISPGDRYEVLHPILYIIGKIFIINVFLCLLPLGRPFVGSSLYIATGR